MSKQQEAIDRIINDIMAKQDLTSKDVDTLLKTLTLQTQFERQETERLKIKTEADTAKYTADKRLEEAKTKAEADAKSAKYTADTRVTEANIKASSDYNAAEIRAKSDNKTANKQLIGNVISTVASIGGTILTTVAVIGLFNEGMAFEQTGVFTSDTVKQIFNTGLSLIRRK